MSQLAGCDCPQSLLLAQDGGRVTGDRRQGRVARQASLDDLSQSFKEVRGLGQSLRSHCQFKTSRF